MKASSNTSFVCEKLLPNIKSTIEHNKNYHQKRSLEKNRSQKYDPSHKILEWKSVLKLMNHDISNVG